MTESNAGLTHIGFGLTFVAGMAVGIFLDRCGKNTETWSVDGGKATYTKGPTTQLRTFINSTTNPLTGTFVDRFTVSDFSAQTLTVKGIDDQALKEATSLVTRQCEVQQIIDVDLPTGRERLVFVSDKACLDQLGK